MTVFSGKDGRMTWAGGGVARVRNWSIQGSLDTLDVTNLGNVAREFVPGLKGATGSATIFYHDDNASLASIIDNCIATGEVTSANMTLGWGTKQLTFNAYINGVTIACSTGEVMSADISFTMSGDYNIVTL